MSRNFKTVLVYKFKTHNCNELSITDTGKFVKLSGWIHKKRNHGNLFFIDLRDHSGIIQLVIYNQEINNNKLKKKDLIVNNFVWFCLKQ
jgi:aspartyl-tRNA synthetase